MLQQFIVPWRGSNATIVYNGSTEKLFNFFLSPSVYREPYKTCIRIAPASWIDILFLSIRLALTSSRVFQLYTHIYTSSLAPRTPRCTNTSLVNHLALPYLYTDIRRTHTPRPFSGAYTVDIPSSHITYIPLLSVPFFDQPRSIREYLDRTHHVRRNGIDA